MQKTILLPTDFQIESLNLLKQTLLLNTNAELDIILLNGQFLSSSIVDLMFYSPQKMIDDLVKPSFHDALSILKNRFDKQVANVRIEFFHGVNKNAFLNFIDANKIDECYIPKKYILKKSKRSFDILEYIHKSNLTVYEIDWPVNLTGTSETDQLITLFS